jgi:glycerate dehydrogenase
MRIVVLDGYTLTTGLDLWAPFRRLGDVEVYDRSAPAEVAPRAAGANVLIVNKAQVTADVIAKSPELRLVAVTATGYDCVDVAAARKRGIDVCNVPEYGTDGVAQYVFALLLELCHRVGLHADAVRAGEWTACPDFCFWKTPLVELAGKTMGIVGFGRIGRRVGEIAHGFGMSVLAHSRSHGEPPKYSPFSWGDLNSLFERSDVISLHCPSTPESVGFVNRERLSLMKPSAFLINTARGALVVEPDLAEALNADRLAGAAVDVVSKEPIRPDNPLLSAKNCLITPHMAWAGQESRQRLFDATLANVENSLAGRPTNVVNRG